MIACEHDKGAFWTICTFYGWYLVMMCDRGQFVTFSKTTH